MKKLTLWLVLLLILPIFVARAGAEEIHSFDHSIEELKGAVDADTRDRMAQLGLDSTDIAALSGITLNDSLAAIGEMTASAAKAPLSACMLLIAVILLAALLEGYSYSLRYADTRDVMNAVTSLTVIATVVTPAAQLIGDSLEAARTAAGIMLVYAPLMMGVAAFTGHVFRSTGCYATVLAASEGVARLSSDVPAPLLHCFLALSVSSAITDRIRLNSLCELIGRVMKWSLTCIMTVYTAVLSLHGFAANAVDSVASKTVRFTLSSFIPIVGASITEAYRTVGSSVALLRSGIGVFAVAAVILTFLPLILRIVLWQLAVQTAKTVAEIFGVTSAAATLNALSTVLSVLIALVAVIAAVLLISTGALIAVGGEA